MKYRRVYSHGNPDGSTTVTSYGPLTTGASKFWRSPFATGFVFFIAFLLLDPWPPGSTANLIWAVCWGGVGFTLHVLHPTWIRGAKQTRPADNWGICCHTLGISTNWVAIPSTVNC